MCRRWARARGRRRAGRQRWPIDAQALTDGAGHGRSCTGSKRVEVLSAYRPPTRGWRIHRVHPSPWRRRSATTWPSTRASRRACRCRLARSAGRERVHACSSRPCATGQKSGGGPGMSRRPVAKRRWLPSRSVNGLPSGLTRPSCSRIFQEPAKHPGWTSPWPLTANFRSHALKTWQSGPTFCGRRRSCNSAAGDSC
jgi:hypothetical protein